MEPIAVYVHTPFCPSKCGYCDFNSYAMSGEIMVRTTDATIRQLRQSPILGRPAKTIFLGGGTPTYLPTDCLVRLIKAILEVHPPVPGAEITCEANPGTVDWPKFRAMRDAGVNRLSLGAQSFAKEDLVRLGRVHRAGEVGRAVAEARRAGFDNLNLDLMFALPGQSARGWESNLRTALALEPDHLSLYCLTIEQNTRYFKLHQKGMLDLPDDDAQVAMFDRAISACAEAGLNAYEISNYAKPGRECHHNLCYWRGEEYAAYGPGAVGRIGRTRFTHLKHPERFCEAVESGTDTRFDIEALDDRTMRDERVMLGLRLAEGVPEPPDGWDADALRTLLNRDWVTVEGPERRLRLTPQGRHYCSDAAIELMRGPEPEPARRA